MKNSKELLIEFYQNSANEMYRSLQEDNLSDNDKLEWYGYIRGVRDCAHEARILSKTSIQTILENSLVLIKDIPLR